MQRTTVNNLEDFHLEVALGINTDKVQFSREEIGSVCYWYWSLALHHPKALPQTDVWDCCWRMLALAVGTNELDFGNFFYGYKYGKRQTFGNLFFITTGITITRAWLEIIKKTRMELNTHRLVVVYFADLRDWELEEDRQGASTLIGINCQLETYL